MKFITIYSRKIILITAILLLVLLVLSVCSAPATIYHSESLEEISLSSQLDSQRLPVNPADTFSTDTPIIYCSFKPSVNSVGKSVSAQWLYIKGDVENLSNYIVDEWTEPVKNQSRLAMFIRRPGNGWPGGDYKVVLSVNQKEEISIPFTIK